MGLAQMFMTVACFCSFAFAGAKNSMSILQDFSTLSIKES